MVKIKQIKDYCKQNNLVSALSMQQDLRMLTHQLLELEQRASVTSMFSSYLKNYAQDDDLSLYQGLSQQKQFFILRKQYDSRMK